MGRRSTLQNEIQLEFWPETPSLGPKGPEVERAAVPAPRPPPLSNLELAVRDLKMEATVVVRFTQNRSVILSISQNVGGHLVLRAHESFRSAPVEIAEAIALLYLKRLRKDTHRRLSHLVTCWHHTVATPPLAPERSELIAGTHHNLTTTLALVNREWFDGQLSVDITYAEKPSRRLMGKHQRRRPCSLILINPVLDHPWITAWYLNYLIYHECLHELIPPRSEGGRMLIHPKEFRARERKHPDSGRAKPYERWFTGRAWRELHRAFRRRHGFL